MLINTASIFSICDRGLQAPKSDLNNLRATSHTRLRARDHYTSSTPIGGKGGAGPSSLHITLEGPTEFVRCKTGVKFTWIILKKPPLGSRSNTKPGDHGILNAHNRSFILFYHAWGLTWVEIHWNNIWLRVQSHMTSHYTWWSGTTLCDFGGVLGQPLDTFFWALTISWSRLLAHVWSGPNWWSLSL